MTERRATLYSRLLGAAWQEVAEPLQRAHAGVGEVHGFGTFRIQHGPGVLARALVRLLQLPRAADQEAVELRVSPAGKSEKWIRSFGQRQLVTHQQEVDGGLLGERVGCLEFRFGLTVHNGAIHYRQQEARLWLGPWSVALPSKLAPVVAAVESAPTQGGGTEVDVRVSAPLAGLLLHYGGSLALRGETPC